VEELASIAVLVSGSGTNLQAIIDACESGELRAKVELVVSNKSDAFALERAEKSEIRNEVQLANHANRRDYDIELAKTVSQIDPDLVVLAGWNRLLTREFLSNFVVVNIHPALPGAFPGLGAIEKSFEAGKKGEVTTGGVMVHYVPDEGVDNGPVIDTEEVPFIDGETLSDYEKRIHKAEHKLFVRALNQALAEMFPI